VRAIKDPLAQSKGIAGATELGDQRVVLILDIGALREFAMNARH
jgi:two-component system chemotaxis sensor kinase CheA